MTETPVRAPGRPRSAMCDDAIVDATIALLVEDGFDRLSMDGVAARAGVGKATIYRRWPSKEALVIEAVARRTDPFPAEPAEGPVRDRLVALLDGILVASQTGVGRLLPCMVGASVTNPALAAHYREQIIGPRRARVRAIVQAGVDAGELRAGLDVDRAIDQLVGPLVYRIVFAGDRPAGPGDCAAIVDLALAGLAP
jgi:AcrR family transcriptional regulator